MRHQIEELKHALNLMIEPELKESITQLCRYLLHKYGEYNVNLDDDDEDNSTPYSLVKTEEYVVIINREAIVCQNLFRKDDEFYLVSTDCDADGVEQSKLIALSTLERKNNHIAVLNALIQAIEGLHRWEDAMFGENE